jgi:hypothetical protein
MTSDQAAFCIKWSWRVGYLSFLVMYVYDIWTVPLW